jgi:SP family arabinose:H+ symporter-like MFS transporter
MTPTARSADKSGSLLFVYLASVVAATSGLLFGFDIAVINGALIFLRQHFALTELQTEIAVSSLLAGCVLGAAVAGYLSDHFGRRRILMVSALLFAASAIGAAMARDLTEFVMARLVGGIGIGVSSVLAPLYIAEVAPPRLRGRLVSMNQMAIVTGILVAYLVNWLLSFLGPTSWRWMFAVAAVPSILFFITLFFVPESPRWLTEFGREEEALTVLARVAGRTIALTEMQEIRAAIEEESGRLADLLLPGRRRALGIAVGLAILQQITGINTVLFYGSLILKERVGNHSASSAIGANVTIGLINFAATVLALLLIDRTGRKPLLMMSSGVMALAQASIGLAFLIQPPPAILILSLMLLCVAAFAVGLGPCVWVVLAEVFPTRIRGRAMSIATISLWIACVALTSTFLTLANALSVSGAFGIYSLMCAATFLLVWRALPETKGKTLEEIEHFWISDTSSIVQE